MIGDRFGKWEVVAATERTATAKKLKTWICRCDCGTKRFVAEQSLKNGRSKSCGNCTPWRAWQGPKDQKHEAQK